LDPVAFLIVVVLLAVVVAIVAGPLRARHGDSRGEDEADVGALEGDVAALEAAREAKYREIRDAELDYRTGKLSEADWRGLDEQLRAEAVAILRRLDGARSSRGS
jgi:hypothetical protein